LVGGLGLRGCRCGDGVVAAVDEGDRTPDQQRQDHESTDDDPGDDRPVAALTAPAGRRPHRARRLGRAASAGPVGLLAAVARTALCRAVRRLRRPVGRLRRTVLTWLAVLAGLARLGRLSRLRRLSRLAVLAELSRLAVGRLLWVAGTVLSGRAERPLLPSWLLRWILRHHTLLWSTTAAATPVRHGTAPAWRQRPEPISVQHLSPGRLTQRRKPL